MTTSPNPWRPSSKELQEIEQKAFERALAWQEYDGGTRNALWWDPLEPCYLKGCRCPQQKTPDGEWVGGGCPPVLAARQRGQARAQALVMSQGDPYEAEPLRRPPANLRNTSPRAIKAFLKRGSFPDNIIDETVSAIKRLDGALPDGASARQVLGDSDVNDAVATQLRQIVARYGLEVCEDPRRVEALLRDLSGEHRREIAVLAGAAREGVPAELLAAKDTAPAPVLAERLARMLQDNLGLADEAAQWAVATWASALDVTGLSPSAPASVKHQATRSTAHPVIVDAQTRITRLLDEAISAALSITNDWKAYALINIAGALAATDPGRAARLLDEAVGAALSIASELEMRSALISVAEALAATDPGRAARLLDDAERLARSITNEVEKVPALSRLATAALATAPGRAARLLDDAERLARSYTDDLNGLGLISVAEALAVTDPGRAARLLDDAERLLARPIPGYEASSYPLSQLAAALAATDPDRAERVAERITSEFEKADELRRAALADDKASALVSVAEALAATDPDRVARLGDEVERLARSITNEYSKADALRRLAAALAVSNPDRAERLARSITDGYSKAWGLISVAEALAATDPGRAARLLDDAERLARSITGHPATISGANMLLRLAKAWSFPQLQTWP